MPSVRKEREEAVAVLTKTLEDIQGLVVAEFSGVKTPEINELRGKLRPLQGDLKVVKNTLAAIALKNRGIEGFSDHFTGPSALVVQKGDAMASLKVLMDFAGKHQNLKVRAGYMGGKVFQAAELKSIAALPPKPVLLAMLLGRMQAPLQNLHGVLTANLTNLACALDQVAKRKGKDGGAAAPAQA